MNSRLPNATMSSSKQRPAPTGPGNHLGGRPRKACDECRSLKVCLRLCYLMKCKVCGQGSHEANLCRFAVAMRGHHAKDVAAYDDLALGHQQLLLNGHQIHVTIYRPLLR